MEEKSFCDLHNVNDLFYSQNTSQLLFYFDGPSENEKLTPLALCNYVKNNLDICEGGGYIDWTELEICSFDNNFIQKLYIIGAIFFFGFLFLFLSTTADEFFCSNIAAIIDFHKISQNVAGITFMAFGNGAPDIFTSIASVVSADRPQAALAISELLGGCIFVNTVVVAAIVLTQPFDVMRRPIIRDILFYLFPISILTFSVISEHKIVLLEPILFLVIYAIYTFTVISGSFVHKRMSKRKRRSQSNREAIIQAVGFTPQPVKKHKRGRSSSSISLSQAKVVPTYGIQKSTITDLMSEYESKQKEHHQKTVVFDQQNNNLINLSNRSASLKYPTLGLNNDLLNQTSLTSDHSPISESSRLPKNKDTTFAINLMHQQSEDFDEFRARSYIAAGKFFGKEELDNESEDTITTSESATPTPNSLEKEQRKHSGLSIEAKRGQFNSNNFAFVDVNFRKNPIYGNHEFMPKKNKMDIVRNFLESISPIDIEKFFKASLIKKLFYIVKAPCTLILKLTVPLGESQWCKSLCMLHTFLIPLLFFFAFQLHKIIGVIENSTVRLTVIILGFIVFPSAQCIAIYFFTTADKTPKYYVIIAAYVGFITSIAWIYWAAAEVVNVVIMFGNILGISYQILGLTAVSWSNCIGDLVADISVARKGFPRMAFSAAIGGPLFNVLIGFGVTFTITTFRTGKLSIDDKHAYNVNIVMLAALTLSLLSTLILLFVRKFYIGRSNGVFLIVLYIAFITTAISINQVIPGELVKHPEINPSL